LNGSRSRVNRNLRSCKRNDRATCEHDTEFTTSGLNADWRISE
jgi:hypothetical protein